VFFGDPLSETGDLATAAVWVYRHRFTRWVLEEVLRPSASFDGYWTGLREVGEVGSRQSEQRLAFENLLRKSPQGEQVLVATRGSP
jgi:hypothetical protein